MITIYNYITEQTTNYAENDKEYFDSIFSYGASLVPFKKIKKTKSATLYFTDKDKGYFERFDGLFGKFGRLDNGRLFYQWTTEKINRI